MDPRHYENSIIIYFKTAVSHFGLLAFELAVSLNTLVFSKLMLIKYYLQWLRTFTQKHNFKLA